MTVEILNMSGWKKFKTCGCNASHLRTGISDTWFGKWKLKPIFWFEINFSNNAIFEIKIGFAGALNWKAWMLQNMLNTKCVVIIHFLGAPEKQTENKYYIHRSINFEVFIQHMEIPLFRHNIWFYHS